MSVPKLEKIEYSDCQIKSKFGPFQFLKKLFGKGDIKKQRNLSEPNS